MDENQPPPNPAGILAVTDRLSIPLGEFQFEFARSGGPGGQNVNKVNSKAVLRWKPGESPKPVPFGSRPVAPPGGLEADQ